MQLDRFTNSKRKGITPIIATVLLLGITVAIGLTVYTQAQGLIENAGDTSNLDRVQATDISLSPVFGSGGEMQLQITNKGDRAINTSDFTIYYGPPNWGPQTWANIDNQASDWTKDTNECFTGSGELLDIGERTSCATGIKFPGALEAVEIEVEADDFDYSESYTCEVSSSSTRSC